MELSRLLKELRSYGVKELSQMPCCHEQIPLVSLFPYRKAIGSTP